MDNSAAWTLADVLQDRLKLGSDRPAYTFLADGEIETSSLSYRALDLRARAIAAILESAGLRGERALLLYGAGLDFVTAFWGCLYAGVVAVPAYPPKPRDRSGRLESLAVDCRPRAVLTTAALGLKIELLSCTLVTLRGENGWYPVTTDDKGCAYKLLIL